MKSIFDTTTINEFKVRIEKLDANAPAQWGKMNVYQMLKHCTENELMMLEEQSLYRRFMGRLFGKLVLKSIVKNEKGLQKNTPTHPDLIIKGNGDVEKQKQLWIAALEKYPTKKSNSHRNFIHPFFGKMTREEVDILAYKHIEHHLTQFGV